MWYVYILYSVASGRTYTGYTNNVSRRVHEHNVAEAKGFTLRYRPWTLVRVESYSEKADAINREKFLKTGHGRAEVKTFVEKFLQDGAVSASAEKD